MNPLVTTPKDKALLLAQLVLVPAIIAGLPGNLWKLLALLFVWALSFRRPSRQEWVMVAFACVFFTAMNAASLQQGIFSFSHPDLLGMPVFELFMWGFYLLHVTRLLGGPVPPATTRPVWLLALLYAAAFALIANPRWLLIATAALLALALLRHHEPADLRYTAYMVLLGALIEYSGVHSGQWHYPGDVAGGVPPWFVTLWGGVGFFLRRLVHPVLSLPRQPPAQRA